MNKQITLNCAVKYSDERIVSEDVSIDSFISTDNILQNKQGITKAVNLPPKGNMMPAYQKENILVGNIRPYLKKIWFSDNSGGCSADVLVFKVKNGYNPKFIYYALYRDDFFQHMMRGSKGTKMPRGNKNQILNFLIPDFELPIQEKISAALTVIDNKIEINKKINYQLEGMAKTLYDYWFVQFDFPNENGKPYKNNGGKMVWNENLKRKIPEGWQCYELSNIISRVSTGLNPRKNFVLGNGNNYYVTIKNIDNGKILLDDKCDKINNEALKIINDRSDLQIGDVLFTSIEPVGVTYLIQEKPENWNINESVFTIRPEYKLVSSEYAYYLLSSDEIRSYTKNVSAGSIHKGIRIGVLNRFKTVYSNKKLISEFSNSIRPFLKQINIIEKENKQLSDLRNWLLPMLMNGQVKVN